MRQPYQVIVFPYVKTDKGYLYAIFKRRDLKFWQAISGGGENRETPVQTAEREAFEEAKIDKSSRFIKLDSMTTIPIANVGNYKWAKNILVLPEYSFGVELASRGLKIGEEHSSCKWLPYKKAEALLKYDSNKSALWELNYRLTKMQRRNEAELERSFGLLKPDCLKRGKEAEILALIESFGLKIVAKKRVRLTREIVDAIWPSCRAMDFYEDMVRFSLSGDCIVFIAEGEDAINKLNDLVGHYDPAKAEKGTIRQLFGTSAMENIIHSSSDEEAYLREKSFFKENQSKE